MSPSSCGARPSRPGRPVSTTAHSGPAEHVSQAWLDGLVDAAGKGSMPVDSFEIDDTYSISMNGYAPSGYQLLGPLLRDDGHSLALPQHHR